MNATNVTQTKRTALAPARHLMTLVKRYLRNRRQYRDLSDLPEHLLWDIGLTRADVARAVRSNQLL